MLAESIPSQVWIEVDLKQYARNLEIVSRAKTDHVRLGLVLKDNAYGHGAVELGKIAQSRGVEFIMVATVAEAVELSDAGITTKILIFGERHPDEIATCIRRGFRIVAGSSDILPVMEETARALDRSCFIHVKIDSGMSRYGIRWSEAFSLGPQLASLKHVQVEGVFSHFAMSDEEDKTFALLQLERFNEAVARLSFSGLKPQFLHMSNSGGLLTLPQAHYNLVRTGILPLGVYPSKACPRLAGVEPVMTVKARVAALKNLQAGDSVGYGMRFTAERPMRIATLPVGYGWGYPRVRNQGAVLLHGKRAPIIGGVSMDAMSVDVTNIPETRLWDEAVLAGKSGSEEISIHEIAALKNSVSYDAMTAWRSRIPRVYLR